MSILSKIKKGVESSGSNKGKVVFIREGSKVRLRFLTDIENAMEVTIHDSYDRGINAICQEHFGEKCPYCDEENIRTRQAYVFSAFDYDSKEVKLFVGYANNFNPLPQLVGMYEAYGSLIDRDYVIGREGKQTNTKYTVVPMDKVKFKNSKAKEYSKQKLLDILNKAYPVNEEDVIGKKSKKKAKVEDEDDEDLEDEDNVKEYDGLTPKELYIECKERGLKAKPKQKAAYYIEMLEEDDKKDSDDNWEDDDSEEDGEW